MRVQVRSCSMALNGIFLSPFAIHHLAFAQFPPNGKPPEINLSNPRESEKDSDLNIATEPTFEWIRVKQTTTINS